MVNIKAFFTNAPMVVIWVMAIFLHYDRAFAQNQDSSNEDLTKWLAEGQEKLLQLADHKFVPVRVAIVSAVDVKAGIKLMKIDPVTFNNFGMFRLVDSTELLWSLMVNKASDVKAKKDEAQLDLAMQQVFGVSGSDLVAYAPEKDGDPWSIRIDNGHEIQAVIATAQIPKERDIGRIYNWILGSLGYNGIILDQRSDLFLVASKPENLIQEAQAVVLGDSTHKTSIDQKNKSGTALLKLVANSGIFGVFKLAFQKPGKPNPKIGDKLSISE